MLSDMDSLPDQLFGPQFSVLSILETFYIC